MTGPMTLSPPGGFSAPAAIQAKVFAGILNATGLDGRGRSALLATEGLREADLAGFAATIPLGAYARMFDRLASLLGNPTLGLDIAHRVGPGLVGAIGYVFLYSPSLGAAIQSFSESVFSIQGVTRLSFERGPPPTLAYVIADETIHPRRHDVEFSLGYVHALIRAYLGDKWTPREVHFEHVRIGDRSKYDSVFGCPVYFEQDRNAMVLDPQDLERGAASADPNLVAILKHYIELVGDRQAVTTLTESINQVLSGLIETQPVPMSKVAAHLGVSEETLRRRLREEGTSFRDIVRRKRIAIARRYLLETRMSVLQVAQRVGYGETASFTRAFIAETGTSPLRFRSRP